ncbi:MAG: hypothetical protein LWX56_05100 [Ignavibacteria bacterium]|nr:hypothetical protein [Ignavibacteria bacterium]
MFDLIEFDNTRLAKEDRLDIIRNGIYVGSFFIMMLRNFNVKGFGKLNIYLSDDDQTRMDVKLFTGNVCLSVIKKTERYQEYKASDTKKKNMILLEELMETLEFVCEYYQWDIKALRHTYEICKRYNLEYDFLYGPVKQSRNRKYKVIPGARMYPERVEVFVLICDAKTNRVIKEVCIDKLEYQYYYSVCATLGKRGWQSNEEYFVLERGDYRKHIISVETGEARMELQEKDEWKLLSAAYNLSRPKLINHPDDIREGKYFPLPYEN